MYINPFFAGILFTVFAELLLWFCWYIGTPRSGGKKA